MPVGEIASLAAALCWAVGLNLFRRDVTEIGAAQVNLFKGIVGTALFGLALLFGGFGSITWEAQIWIAASGAVGLALGDTLLFRALAHLGPHRTALFGCLGPVLTALGGWLLLGESLGLRQVAGVLLAAGGVALVVSHGGSGAVRKVTLVGAGYGVLAALCQAAGVLLVKRGLAPGTDLLAATALRLATATAILAVVALFVGGLGRDLRRLTTPRVLRRLVPAAFVGTFLGLWLMITGIGNTKSAIASALHSTTPLFTLPIALVLRERVGWRAVVGAVLGVAGVVLLVTAGL